MTKKNTNYFKNKYFIICVLKPTDKDQLKRVFKRFVSSNLEELRALDKDNKMFYDTGNFKELKGSCFNASMKKKFIDFFCQNNLFELFVVVCQNQKVKPFFYDNTARAFNYLLKQALEYFTDKNLISKAGNYIYIDERNVKTDTKSTLKEYLNTELVTGKHIQEEFTIEYCASETRELIQIADVFANIYHTNLISPNCLKMEIRQMFLDGYIKKEFLFPL